MSGTSWRGRPVLDNETPDTVIKWWQVSPHPTDPGRVLVVRSWQKLLQSVGVNIDTFLESSAEDQLAGGVSMEFKLVHGTLRTYKELSDECNERQSK